MKISYLKIIALFMFISLGAFAQKGSPAGQRVIIDTRGVDYHTLKELESANKGQLMDWYCDRIKVLINVLPYMGNATKVGVTLKDAGINETPEIGKLFDEERTNKNNFISSNAIYMKQMLQFADKGDIIKAIMFFEEILQKQNKGGAED